MNLWKSGLSVAVGYAAWTLIFLGGTAAIRALRPGVHDEAGVTSDIATLSIYLVISFVASLVAGVLAAQIAPRAKLAHGAVLAICLLATGIPVQLSAWDDLPLWYNLVFLVMLVPLTLAGAGVGSGSRAKASPTSISAAH